MSAKMTFTTGLLPMRDDYLRKKTFNYFNIQSHPSNSELDQCSKSGSIHTKRGWPDSPLPNGNPINANNQLWSTKCTLPAHADHCAFFHNLPQPCPFSLQTLMPVATHDHTDAHHWPLGQLANCFIRTEQQHRVFSSFAISKLKISQVYKSRKLKLKGDRMYKTCLPFACPFQLQSIQHKLKHSRHNNLQTNPSATCQLTDLNTPALADSWLIGERRRSSHCSSRCHASWTEEKTEVSCLMQNPWLNEIKILMVKKAHRPACG